MLSYEHRDKHWMAGFLMGTALAISAPPAWAAQPLSTSTPVVVELYTSQGYSSCPPADALLGELAALSNVIALSFHADYWDSIGWRDGFAMPEASRRQARYVEMLGLPGVEWIEERGAFFIRSCFG